MAEESRTSVLRRARPRDADALARLERAAFVGCYAAHRFAAPQFAARLARPASFAHVVEGRGRIVAYVLGVQGGGSRTHVARLDSIAVDPRARRRDLATRLVRAFLAAARRRGCTIASLEVAATNRAALALFARHGFAITRRLPAYYSRTAAGLRMRRELAGRASRLTAARRSRSPCRPPR
ncbi:MAG: GNAT family N-acetyltransferase [Deltaproteobacteria bacterium]|nr:GNAT family N-acetyltransferase [Deltaproteobacteria bacterium]